MSSIPPLQSKDADAERFFSKIQERMERCEHIPFSLTRLCNTACKPQRSMPAECGMADSSPCLREHHVPGPQARCCYSCFAVCTIPCNMDAGGVLLWVLLPWLCVPSCWPSTSEPRTVLTSKSLHTQHSLPGRAVCALAHLDGSPVVCLM